MSWLFSLALVEASSAGTSSDGEPSAQLNVMPTQHPFWHRDRTMEPCGLSRFGLTYAVFEESRGEAVLTSFLADFPVRESVSPARETDSMTSEAPSGEKWRASWVKYDRPTSTWKTHQLSLVEGLETFSGTWPRWGLMRAGECWELDTSEDGTFASESGSWLPTLGKTEFKGTVRGRYRGSREYRGSRMCEGLRTCEDDPTYLSPSFAEYAMGWPLTWTELAPLGMDRFRQWRQQHGES